MCVCVVLPRFVSVKKVADSAKTEHDNDVVFLEESMDFTSPLDSKKVVLLSKRRHRRGGATLV